MRAAVPARRAVSRGSRVAAALRATVGLGTRRRRRRPGRTPGGGRRRRRGTRHDDVDVRLVVSAWSGAH